MGITTFAAIYIGSYEVNLKIFELSFKKQVRVIDHVRQRVEIGRDAYGKGYIGYELMDELCDILNKFSEIMEGYQVDAYQAYTSTVIGNAKNALFIIDQIRLRTRLDVQVLTNSEQRFISYKAVACRPEFDQMTKESAAVVDVGGGSVQITLFVGGKVVTTQNILLGTMRIKEKLQSLQKEVTHYEHEVQELVDKELGMFRALYLQDTKIKYVMMLGNYISEICMKMKRDGNDQTISYANYAKRMQKLLQMEQEDLTESLNMHSEKDPLLTPAIVLYKQIVEVLHGEKIWVPGSNISDGIAYDYAQRYNIIKPKHNFDEDILSAAKALSVRYMSYTPHIDALAVMSSQVFDAMKRVHGLGKREKLLLKVAAILHDCGKYVSLSNSAECSYEIIMASEIIGLTHKERELVANTVKYNTRSLPDYEEMSVMLNREDYLIVAKLAAILKLSNAMDRSHKQKFKNVKIVLKEKRLIITIETADTILLEKGLFAPRAEFFEKIFSIKPVIREKSVYL